ncbi:hypothetical protein LEP1GSC050_2477 [Leptospira broomii serovar Hurstbridge str. 5399]|uniref:Uncharacterized protein n=1 Tax=Leptospira broomii serovar Hurstbridge str. 5399 TaxID=1049789 RepID=T0GC96_9LEPT|nr:hypothetical protein LEP1GSC050_2477 [Leptospira broomii serovar Hurstbridge str. 5399]
MVHKAETTYGIKRQTETQESKRVFNSTGSSEKNILPRKFFE